MNAVDRSAALSSASPGGRVARRPRRWPRRLAVALVILAAASAAAYHVYKTNFATDPLADLLVAAATIGDVEQSVQATGSLRPVQLVAVGAQVSGRITKMNAVIGQRVAVGDLIAEIDNVTQQNDLKSAEAALEDVQAQKRQKEATLAYDQWALEREEKTLAKEATSRDSWESAKEAVETTRAQIDSLAAQIKEAEVKVDSARVQLGYTRITAPIDGTVLLVAAQEGQNVNAVQSAPTIAILGRIDRMLARAEISEADAPKVKIGQKAVFSILGESQRQWEATLLSLDPAPDSLRSDSEIASSSNASSSSSSSSTSSTSSAIYYYGRFEVDNSDGVLRTYMTAQVRIVLDRAKGVITIPTAALSAPNVDGKRSVETVAADGSVSRRAVEVGLDDKARCEIRSGLKAGERVVVGRRSSETKAPAMPGPPGGL
ncbi:MAG: efflux RND transporter periplasmic adaptor subunit [Roseiarcus sp.]|jgi:macrolide-specific efflux system membrane fusion protein